MPEAQEALKEDNLMVDLDTSGKAVDVELKEADAKESRRGGRRLCAGEQKEGELR